MNQKSINLPIRLLTITTPAIMMGSFHLPVAAGDMSSYIQTTSNAINNSTMMSNQAVYDSMAVTRAKNAARDRNHSNKTSSNSGRDSSQTNNSRINTGTTFIPDPNITRQVQNSFVSKIDDPRGKKFLTLFLTPERAKQIFGQLINPNDMVDVFTAASLYSFLLIEDKSGINKEQVRSTKQRFRKHFTARSIDSATMQRSSERLLYWTMLIAYSQLKAEQGNADTPGMGTLKANAAKMMTGIGLNPQQYTLGSRGFVEK
jgi:hypothetical protein